MRSRECSHPSGAAVISTPDKAVYSDAADYENEFHLHEFYEDEFRVELGKRFSSVFMMGQRTRAGSELVPLDPSSSAPQPVISYFPDAVEPGEARRPPAALSHRGVSQRRERRRRRRHGAGGVPRRFGSADRRVRRRGARRRIDHRRQGRVHRELVRCRARGRVPRAECRDRRRPGLRRGDRPPVRRRGREGEGLARRVAAGDA